MTSFETTEDAKTWSAWLAEAGIDDVYYSFQYLETWAHEELGRSIGIRYESPRGRILYPLVLVPLDSLPGGSGLVEARTPYDFGGPWADGPDLRALHGELRDVLVDWLQGRGVVSEFARIHPLREGGQPADAAVHAENLIVDVTGPYDELFSSQHRRHRRAVRAFHRHNHELHWISDISDRDATAFTELYARTMARVAAGTDYRFSDTTLSALMALDEMSLVQATSETKPLGAALFLRSGDDLFYYLGASADDRPAGTNNAIFDAAIRNAQSRGMRTLHLGGGSESLRAFKSQIATGTVPYSVLRRIIDEPRYTALCRACGASGSTYFPAFRPELIERRQR
ncbi:MAG: GNAT family N-acetyltransferase [Deltaproteobacteria bacterium]|nr:GNAT family N-acetyltransferase [Deltaproteobacteria bacterium]NND27707.1 GNAT family N-acetyltransferase [Myxococcales bacterium]MBT8466203.1 GNAT family N-acetyltransferase [Deltaproteobacteria bacterium]MBT8480015.1 GNAT family N-acetyltransferase [Deltaproteobacteria bacterium]NNK06656.1 GNAT family N-acetyltransferase [Myxococcales bacterium]